MIYFTSGPSLVQGCTIVLSTKLCFFQGILWYTTASDLLQQVNLKFRCASYL